MIGLLAFFLRIGVLLLLTFGFVVLYEHGPKDYWESAREEGKAVWEWGMGKKSSRTSSAEDLAEPAPAPSPTATPIPEPSPETTPPAVPTPTPSAAPTEPSSTAPEAWRDLQDTSIGTTPSPQPSKQSP